MRTAIELTSVEFKVVVNRELTLAEMISAGHYDWVSDSIMSERFLSKGSGLATSFGFVHFNYDISSEDAVKEMDKRGLRPADLAELLAFGAVFPKEQLRYPIVELVSVAEVGGARYVACLRRFGSRRRLSLSRWDDGWDASCRFLAVCK